MARVMDMAAGPADGNELIDEDEPPAEAGDDYADDDLDAIIAEDFYADALEDA